MKKQAVLRFCNLLLVVHVCARCNSEKIYGTQDISALLKLQALLLFIIIYIYIYMYTYIYIHINLDLYYTSILQCRAP